MGRFIVIRIESLVLTGPDRVTSAELMSPYVWPLDDGRLGLLVRVVSDDGSTGSLWYGEGADGLSFRLEDVPVLTPGPDTLDAAGCEDPTVVLHDGQVIVFYTGVDRDGGGRLLWASGRDIRSLTKHGVALGSFDGEQDIKEAEISVRDGHWTMGYEYVRDDASLIGYAEGDGPAGPWRETRHGFGPRPDRFDSWHLSPGPMLLDDPERPIMFYNGATHDGRWGIGWVEFDYRGNRVLDRCEEPLIAPPVEEDGRAIAFAASLIDHGDEIDLYLSYNDRSPQRAVFLRSADDLSIDR